MEVSKLQNALETLSGNLDATKVAYLNEQAKNKTVQEQLGLVLKENSSLYDKLAKMEELQKENWFLKCSLESLTKKNLEMEQELMSTRKCSHATADLLQEVEAKCFLLQQNLKDLEEKLVILEDENQILRQKALNLSPRKSLSGALKPIPENHSFASLSSTSNQRFTLETSISPKLPNFLPRSLSDF
ncbi:hypothetical protein HPP92_004152 [Vanilla planifolia]|uniref:Uncharacterized protein n=1 Tax=Vanilla planifolia TaxID=51239 RepID=A0A835RW82_VANPL|nr:hypothetical protein HPP92_004152 [Vanilla planifolia]